MENRLRCLRRDRIAEVDRVHLQLERAGGRPVPAVLWQPRHGGTRPVVLLGHGGSGHKSSDRQQRFATWFAAQAGVASLSIDGPFHGARAASGDGPSDYLPRVVRQGALQVHDYMREDWLDALAAVEQAGLVDGQRVGFIGLSMGTRYGIEACASLASRLRCAVIGKFGLTQSDWLPAGIAAPARIAAAAHALQIPVLQHVQWDDELFPRSGQLDLFEMLPSTEKQLRARSGGHAQTRPDDEMAWRGYVAEYLAA